MLPAPARIAAPPRLKSRTSWNPAVPPPPVAGAAVGNWLADGLGVADGDADRLGVADRLADGLTLALGLLLLADPLGETVGVAEPDRGGEKVVGVAEGVEPEQADTDAEASMAKMAQPAAASLALSPGRKRRRP
jgi:hypothetical protein